MEKVILLILGKYFINLICLFSDIPHGSSCAPNVLIYFIGMMLFKKSEIEKPCDAYMYSGQQSMQKVLLIMALICIPWMLLGAPLYEILFRRKPKVNIQQVNNYLLIDAIVYDQIHM